MDPAAAATAAAAMNMQPRLYDMPVGIAYVDPSMQQQHDGRISYDATDPQAMLHAQAMYQHQFAQHSMPSALLGRKHAPDRRPLRFWQPFNDWWRSELTRLGRRPTSEEIGEWYMEAADRTWGETKPTLQETRVHAKCLRSLPLVRDYFRNYRAKKKAKGSDGSGYDGEDTGDADTEDGTDNGGSSRRSKAGGAKRARLGGATSSNPDAAGGPGQGQGKAAGAADPAEAAAMATMTGAAGYGGLDMLQLQAYQAQYWDQTQTEEYARAIMLQQMQQAAIYQQLAAQQLGGDAQQYALLQQHQQQQQGQQEDQGMTDPDKAIQAATAAAAAAAAAATAPEGGTEPVSGAAGDDEHADHEPRRTAAAAVTGSGSGAGAKQLAQADTATSNVCLHDAAATQADAAAGEAVSESPRDKSASVSRGRSPQQEPSPPAQPARASQGPLAPPSQQQQAALLQVQQDGGESQQQHTQGGQQVEPMQTDEPPATDMHTGVSPRGSSPVAAEPAKLSKASRVKAEDKGMHLGDVADGTAERQQAQPRKPQEQQQSIKPRQQPIELNLGDPAAQPDTADAHTDADAGVNSTQQQQQKAVGDGKVKVPTAAELQAALLSAAAAGATTHGSTAVSPYVQGASAAAAALANAGLNLADSPHAGGAVEQDTPHPGALVPEAAAAAMAAAPPSRLQVQSGNDHRAPTPGVEQGRAVSIDIDEAELLNDVEMGGMSHGELVTHIRKVQQELLSKRELLQRSFDQLRRTQERLARRERKLAKEQQKVKQYQGAMENWQAAWQAAALPSLEPAGPEADNGQAAGGAQAAGDAAAAGTAEAAPAAAAQ